MSFNLNTASTSLRKAAALQGIQSGEWSPVFDPTHGTEQKIATITDGERTITITTGDQAYADHLTWKEIKSR
jgi:hypothetical protein